MDKVKGTGKQRRGDKKKFFAYFFITLSATIISVMCADQNGAACTIDSPSSTSSGTNNPPAPMACPMNAFYKKLLNSIFCGPCSCNSAKCSQDSYLNYPYSCPLIDHPRDHIPILPNKKPILVVDSVRRPYEALHFVDSATRYFCRPYNEMSAEQQVALRNMRENREDLVEKLGSVDARDTFPVDGMKGLCTQLLSIFFLGAEIELEFAWDSDVCQQNGWLGYTQARHGNGDRTFQCITMHPTRQSTAVLSSPDRTESLALQRLSTLTHELIHAVLKSLCCQMCVTSNSNLATHGRAFQKLAMAIEEQCPQLLGLTLDLGRMNGIFMDMTDRATGYNRPSMHDLEVYGFVESLGEKMGVLHG